MTYYRRPFIMEWLGCLCKRKFTTDMALMRSVKKVLQEYGDILCMYPEARYSPIGTTAILPDSLGKLVKKQGVPVVGQTVGALIENLVEPLRPKGLGDTDALFPLPAVFVIVHGLPDDQPLLLPQKAECGDQAELRHRGAV